jgi:hypothetical protein
MSICQRIQSVGGVRARDPDHYVIWVTQPIARRSSLRDQSDRRDAVAESGQNDHYKENSAPCPFPCHYGVFPGKGVITSPQPITVGDRGWVTVVSPNGDLTVTRR